MGRPGCLRPIALSVLLCALPVMLQAQNERESHLRQLGEACLRYADDRGGRLPGSLRALYYEAYLNDLSAFAVPGSGQAVLDREGIDEQSGYALTPSRGTGGAIPVVAEKPTTGGSGQSVACFFSDHTIRQVLLQRAGTTPATAPPGLSSLPTTGAPSVAPGPLPTPAAVPAPSLPPASPSLDPWEPVRRWGATSVDMVDGGPFPAQLLLALSSAQGIRIAAVEPGTVAALLGLLPGDLLVGAAGKPLSSQRDLAEALAAVPPQTPVLIAAVRDRVVRIYPVSSGSLPGAARQALTKTEGTTQTPTAPEIMPTEAPASLPASIPWPSLALWSRAVNALRSPVTVYDSRETVTEAFRERTDKAHLDDGSLAEYRYWLAEGQWRMSRALFKSDAGQQDWLLVEFNDAGQMVAVHHNQTAGGDWRESLNDNDLDGRPEMLSVDVDGDGLPDFAGYDTNGDGLVDRTELLPGAAPRFQGRPPKGE